MLYLKANGQFDSQVLHNIPNDGKKHRIFVYDELIHTKTEFRVKNKFGSTKFIWYSLCDKKTNKISDFRDYTGRIFVKPEITREYNDFEIATEIFLKNMYSDFSRLKQLIDYDMILTEINKHKIWIPQVPENDQYRIFKGYMQSRKTWAIISTAFYYLLKYRLSMFIIVQNSVDACNQLLTRFSEVYSEYSKYLKTQEFQGIFAKFFRIIDCKRGKKTSQEKIHTAMTGKSPRIFVILRNNYDLSHVNVMIEKEKLKRYVLFIDESDFNDSGTKAPVQESLNLLKENASVIYDITATPMTTLMKEKIDAGNVIILSPPAGYKGILDIQFMELTEESCYCSKKDDNPFEMDKNLNTYIDDFSKTTPYIVKSFWGKQKHPRYSLVRVGAAIKPQLLIAEYVQKKYSDKITAITYNGGGYGVTIRGNGVDVNSFRIGRKHSEVKNGVHTFKNLHIGSIIAYLQNIGVKKFPRIMVLAGKMADRGITFATANYSKCIEQKFYPWHLTEMYFIVAKSMSQANLLQAVGRLCGIFPDNIPLHVYTNASKDIIKAHGVQEELISRAIKSRNALETKNEFSQKKIKDAKEAKDAKEIKDIILDQPISRSKCSERRITTPKIPCHLFKVENDFVQGGYDWKTTGYDLEVFSAEFGMGKRIASKKKKLTAEEFEELQKISDSQRTKMIREYKELGIDPEECARLCSLFSKWSQANTKIANFMSNLDPHKKYTKNEIERDTSQYGVRLTDLHAAPGQKRVRYGNILQLVEGKYRLYPCLINAFCKAFNYE